MFNKHFHWMDITAASFRIEYMLWEWLLHLHFPVICWGLAVLRQGTAYEGRSKVYLECISQGKYLILYDIVIYLIGTRNHVVSNNLWHTLGTTILRCYLWKSHSVWHSWSHAVWRWGGTFGKILKSLKLGTMALHSWSARTDTWHTKGCTTHVADIGGNNITFISLRLPIESQELYDAPTTGPTDDQINQKKWSDKS